MTTTAQFTQAAEILEQGAGSRSTPPASTVNHLQVLAEEVYIDRWIVGGIVAEISEWLLGHLGPFQKVLDSLAGDPAAIAAQSRAVNRCGAVVSGSVAQAVSEGERIARQHWQGPAADAYTLVIAALQHCLSAYGTAAGTVASGELAVGERVGAVRQYVTDTCGDMIGELVNEAFRVAPWVVLTAGAAVLEFIRWAAGFISMYLQNVIQVMQELLADVTVVMGQVKGVGDCMERAASVLEGHGDPGAVGDLASGSQAAQYKGTRPDPADYGFARAASGISIHPADDGALVGKDFGGYTRLSDAQVAALGIDPALLRDPSNGFAAGVLYNPDTKQYVVTFAGTDFGDGNDVAEDATGAITLSPQSRDAVRLADAVNASPKLGNNAVYVGHSLGGRLAAVASMESGNPAVTFNAAGVSPATVAYMASQNGIPTAEMYGRLNDGQVRQYSTSDDPLTNVQEKYPTRDVAPDGVGARITLGGSNLNPVDGHGMDNVRSQMTAAYPGFFVVK